MFQNTGTLHSNRREVYLVHDTLVLNLGCGGAVYAIRQYDQVLAIRSDGPKIDVCCDNFMLDLHRHGLELKLCTTALRST